MSETRALSAALSGPVFHGAATRSALHASERHVERWAPEGAAATRSGGMRSLSFADRIAMPWMTAAMQSRGAQMVARPTADRGTPEVSWLFPRPWFQDELDWMAAARQSAEQQPSFLTTRGTYASSRTSMSDIAMPMLTADMVAPSMSASTHVPQISRDVDRGSTVGLSAALPSGFAQVQHSLRSYSPMVPFAAASAAEVVAGTIGMASESGLASAATGLSGRSPILSGLTVVAPSALAGFGPAAMSAPAMSAAPAPMPTTTRVLFEAAKAQVARVEEARHQPAAESAPSTAPSVEAAAPETREAMAERAADQSIAMASSQSPDVARALRTVDLLFQAASSPGGSTTQTASPTESPTGSPIGTGEAPRSSFQPSAGPRVSMPAGLGGLVTAIDAHRATTTPLARMTAATTVNAPSPAPFVPTLARIPAYAAEARTPVAGLPALAGPGAEPRTSPSFEPVWAAPSTALGSIAAERARGVDHVAWSDRWLARFVGASPVALAALDATREHQVPELRSRQVTGPEQIYLQAPQLAPQSGSQGSQFASPFAAMMPGAALAAAIRGSVVQPVVAPAAPARPAMPAVSPDRALRIDDNESVSDDIFAAIAAAAVPTRQAPAPQARRDEPAQPVQTLAERLADARPLTPADVVRSGARPTLADLVAISPPPAPDAGLSPGLASSPLAAAMSGVLPMPAAPTFDPRALFPEAVSSAYLGGFLARSAAPIGVVSAEPTMRALVSAASFASVASPQYAEAGEGASPVGMPLVSPWMSAARAWSSRDQMIAPSSLRLAEAAPARVILSTDVESARRGFSPAGAAPSQIAAAAAAAGAPSMIGPGRPAPVGTAVPPQVTAADDVEPPITAAAPAAAAPFAMPPAVEAELLTLRAALFAAPGPTSTPLAFADHLPLLSAPTAAPSAHIASMSSLSSGSPDAEADAPGPVPAMASLVGAGSLGLPAVGGGATLTGGGLPRGTFGPTDDAYAPVGAGASVLDGASAMYSPAAITSTGRPGSLAEMILSWSVAEERSIANLAFDFVSPEMVLAAKVYGLSPAAAVQASRLAIAGPGAMASLATSVDLTFLRGFQQMHAQDAMRGPGPGMSPSQAQAPGVAPTAARAASRGDVAAPGVEPEMSFGAPGEAAGLPATAFAPPSFAAPSFGAPSSPALAGDPAASPFTASPLASEILGGARLPRGAFLWPEATVAALGLRAQSPDGVAGMPVVALELLAAAAVADLGTWITAFPSADRERISAVLGASGSSTPGGRSATVPFSPAAAAAAAAGEAPSYAAQVAGSLGSPVSPTAAATAAAEAGESASDVLMASTGQLATAPPDVRARFEAIYISLAQTGEGQMMSPSARAARAMSMLARTDAGAALSPRERALTAWSAMPQIYQGDLDLVAASSGGRGDAADAAGTEGRPGLAGLAARAGESLASFVNPSSDELGGWGSNEARPGSLAARSAAPVYVSTGSSSSSGQSSSSDQQQQWIPLDATRAMARPGRTFAQTGGGEPEIPSWFEAAARLALEQRNPGSGMSLAELVLVNAASTPSRAIAASTRGSGSTPAPQHTQGAGASGNQEGEKPDVDKIAHEAYLEVLKLIDIARMRSGDPFQ